MNFIKKIAYNQIDESVHLQFQKFSKGEFINRAVIKAKQSKGKYTINTSSEFANDFVKIVAEKLKESKLKVTGAIVSTNDLTGRLECINKKQFQGVKRYLIDSEMTGNEILNLLSEFPKSFFALSFSSEDSKLKIKPKAPKSGKPGSKGGEPPKPNFCKLVTMDSEVGKSFIFESPNFQEAWINHTFVIEDIVIPEELKGSEDFAKVREESKRKGKIIRKATIDGKETTKEIEFAA